MNRKLLWLSGIVCFLLVFGACASQVIYDKNLPLEESVHLNIYYGVEIIEYNGIPVPHKRPWGPNSTAVSTWHDVYIPSGEAKFMVDVNWEYVYDKYIGKNLLFSFNFDAGKTYTIMFTAFGGSDESEYGVRIFDSPAPKVGLPKIERAIAFVPFINAQGNQRTVLD